MIEVVGILTLGFAAGVTAGLFGVGGGVLAVLALTLVLGLEQLEAQATSLLVVVASTVSERTLEVTFACLVLFVAYRLVRRAFAT